MTSRSDARTPLLVLLAALIFFFVGTTSRDLWETGEHRYAEVARVITEPGNDHVVPHLNGPIYPDKPPLFFWMAGAGHALGLDLPISAKLPSVVCGALTVLLTFLLGRRFYGGAAGLVAAGALATTELFGYAARAVHLDGPVAMLSTWIVYSFVREQETPREQGLRRTLWTASAFLAAGFAMLAKGPPAFLPALVTLIAFVAWNSPRRLATWAVLWGVGLALLPGLVWAATVVAHLGRDGAWNYLWGDLLHGQAIEHAAGDIDKQQPWYYYLYDVPQYLLPWTLLVPAAIHGVLVHGRDSERRHDRLLLVWLVVPWIVFSISVAKRNLYLLPIQPAAALLVGRLFRDLADAPERLRSWWTAIPRWILAASAIVAGAGIVVVVLLVSGGWDASLFERAGARFLERRESWERFRGDLGTSTLVAAAALGVAILGAGVWIARARTSLSLAAATVAAAAAWHTIDVTVLASARDAEESPRTFLEEVGRRVGDAPLLRFGGLGGLKYAVNWVLRRDHVDETQSAARAAAFLAEGHGPRFVVTDAAQVRRDGAIAGAVEVLRRRRHRGVDLILYSNSAPH